MEIPPLLQTGIALSIGGGLLYSLKPALKIIYKKVKAKFVFTVKIYQYDELYDVFEKWLFAYHSERYKDVEASLQEVNTLLPTGRNREIPKCIAYKQEQIAFLIKYKGKKIYVGKDIERLDKAGLSVKDCFFKKWVICGINAKEVINDLLNEAVKLHRSARDEKEVRIFTHYQYGEWAYTDSKKTKSLDRVFINSALREKITSDIKEFVEDEERYTEMGILYKRSYLFWGPPGTGKTSLAMAIALHMKRDIYYLNLNMFSEDSQLKRAFTEIKENAILFIEDIDRCFNGRESSKETKISFSSLLNNMDGALSKHGVITIITTNHLEQLDPALVRPGRADFVCEIPLATSVEVSQFLSLFYDRITSIDLGSDKISMAQVQEVCLRNKRDIAVAKAEIYSLAKQKENAKAPKYNHTLHTA